MPSSKGTRTLLNLLLNYVTILQGILGSEWQRLLDIREIAVIAQL